MTGLGEEGEEQEDFLRKDVLQGPSEDLKSQSQTSETLQRV